LGRHGIAAYAALVVAMPAALGAPPAQEPPKQAEAGMDIEYGHGVSWTEDGVDVTFLTGQVRLKKQDFEVRAARAMVWTRRGSGRPIDEIYAEGNVVFRRGTQELRAERLYFKFEKDRAYMVDLEGEGYSEGLKQPFYVRAREARMAERGIIQAEDVSFSTCSYGVPHYHLEVKNATLRGQDPVPPRDAFDLWPYEDWRFQMEDLYPELVGAPIFFFPGLLLGPWVKNFPLRSVEYGRTSRFGTFVLTEWGHKIQMQAGHHRKEWGEVIVEADWREERGWGFGLDLDYEWDGYSGFIDTYFLHDMGRDPEVSFNLKFPPLERAERGRARFFHRQDLDAHWRFELEVSYLSDRSLLEEYFEKEFKEEKEPETAAYVRWLNGGMGGYLLERHRLNDFQTQNEFLPRGHFDLLHFPLLGETLDNLYLTQRFDAGRIRRRFDEEARSPSQETWRFDSITEVSAPWDLGWFQVSPFAQRRSTVYEDDLEGDTEFREAWTGGGRVAAQVHGTHPWIAWEWIGLRGVRHVMDLEAGYANTVDVNVPPSELFPFEETETLDEFEEVSLEMRHRFKTRGPDKRAFTFLSAGGMIEYYPDSERDTVRLNPNNYSAPFNWLPLAPSGRRHWSNIHWDALLSPSKYFTLGASGQYNPVTTHEEVRQMTVALVPFSGFTGSVSRTWVRKLTDAYTYSLGLDFTEKWSVSGVAQFDYESDRYIRQGLVASRDYHDFYLQLIVDRDFGRDERRIFLSFTPKFMSGAATTRRGARFSYKREGN
jgi:hypothetical protein